MGGRGVGACVCGGVQGAGSAPARLPAHPLSQVQLTPHVQPFAQALHDILTARLLRPSVDARLYPHRNDGGILHLQSIRNAQSASNVR